MPEADAAIRLRVNGRAQTVAGGTTVADLVAELGLDRRFLVVEHNGRPLSRQDLARVILADGDRLELVRPVAGG